MPNRFPPPPTPSSIPDARHAWGLRTMGQNLIVGPIFDGQVLARVGNTIKGIDSPPGPQGEPGEDGAPGATGATGAAGATGPAGADGDDYIIPRTSGEYYVGVVTASGSNGTITQNRLFALPFNVGASRAFDRIAVNSLGVAATNVRLGIYADSNGKPGALILDAGTVATTSAGLAQITISQTLSGRVWLACVGQGGAASVTRVGLLWLPDVGSPSSYSNGQGLAYYQDSISGTLPDPWGATFTLVNAANTAPLITLRAT